MTPPDVAALLARHPLEWSVEDGGVVYEETVELPYVGHVDDIVPALTTALRAALADQQRYQWLKRGGHERIHVTDPVDGCRIWSYGIRSGNTYRRRGAFSSFDDAIDAAMTADGGGV